MLNDKFEKENKHKKISIHINFSNLLSGSLDNKHHKMRKLCNVEW